MRRIFFITISILIIILVVWLSQNKEADEGEMVRDAMIESAFLNEKPAQPSIDNIEEIVRLLPPEKKIIADQTQALINDLKKDALKSGSWIMLGVYLKNLDLHKDAENVWLYALSLNPGELRAHHNLGDLYHYQFKMYAKSESHWKETLKLDPSYTLGYKGLHELYRYSYTERKTESDRILIEGINKNPHDIDLMLTLAGYYRDEGKKNDATLFYEKADKEALVRSDISLSERIQEEIRSLKE